MRRPRTLPPRNLNHEPPSPDKVAKAHADAAAHADRRVSKAVEEAERSVAKVTAEAERSVAEATATADRKLAEAAATADQQVAEATARADRKAAEAEEEAGRRMSLAKQTTEHAESSVAKALEVSRFNLLYIQTYDMIRPFLTPALPSLNRGADRACGTLSSPTPAVTLDQAAADTSSLISLMP